jgi:quinol-cytochrome oxidoreductase complex cytochrome b subunit
VYLTGGFKKPREVTWITGVTLAVCTVSFGVTGYSLPYDQVGYWADGWILGDWNMIAGYIIIDPGLSLVQMLQAVVSFLLISAESIMIDPLLHVSGR